MDLSILIPSFGRPDKLIRCLDGLRDQGEAPAEILVGLDGGDAAEAQALSARFEPLPLRVIAFEKMGYIPIRRRLLAEARGEVFLSLNDDVRPDREFVASHAQAHRSAAAPGKAAAPIVIGPAPFAPITEPTLFDRLVAGSDLVFFGPASRSPDSRRTYRDCYGLNMSASIALARQAGGFPDLRHAYGYDDIELAYRLTRRLGAPIRFEPGAAVEHDHRFTPRDVMRREYELGRSAAAYAEINPEFTRNLFGRGILDPDELGYAREYVRRERRDAERIERSFLSLGDEPAGRLPQGSPLLHTLAEHWILLKRYLWRWGLLDALAPREPRWSLLQDAPALP